MHRVTSVIAAIDEGYRYVNDDTMEYARQRGTAVHRACELHDRGTLDEQSLDPVIVPYLNAYKSFLQQTGFRPELIEEQFEHPALVYRGTLDRAGKLGFRRTLVDIKVVAAIQVASRVQLSAYAELCNRHRILIDERRILQLKPNGSYTLTDPYACGDDFRVFVALLTIKNWRGKYG